MKPRRFRALNGASVEGVVLPGNKLIAAYRREPHLLLAAAAKWIAKAFALTAILAVSCASRRLPLLHLSYAAATRLADRQRLAAGWSGKAGRSTA